MADAPQLFYEDPQTIADRMKARYGELVERVVENAQPESLVFQTLAMEIALHNAKGDTAVSQLLAQFSKSPMLDYLAGNAGLTRLAATPAEALLRFSLIAGHGTVTIPAGSQVRSQDGLMVFATDAEVSAAPGLNSIEITATAILDGPQGNLYAPGLISDLIDAQPFVTSVVNVFTTGGGADIETDEGLRRRILASQNQYSTAGSVDSYKFWALSANPSIIDVAVVSPKDGNGDSIGGRVLLYPLIPGGIDTPQAILDAVNDAVSGQTHRPLTDRVEVYSPTKVTYIIPLEITLKHGAVQSTTEQAVTDAVGAYTVKQSQILGADITASQIIAAGMNSNVHSLRLPGFTDIIVSPTEFAVCTEINKVAVNYEDINA